MVAASVGPYGAVRSDGSEYTGEYDKDRAGLVAFHEARIAQLDASAVDILACETIPSIDEASALSELLLEVATPAWVSFSCRDDARINDGTSIEIAAQLFQDHPNVKAIGVNCTAPQYIEALIARIRAHCRTCRSSCTRIPARSSTRLARPGRERQQPMTGSPPLRRGVPLAPALLAVVVAPRLSTLPQSSKS